jgi:hypothetical protein
MENEIHLLIKPLIYLGLGFISILVFASIPVWMARKEKSIELRLHVLKVSIFNTCFSVFIFVGLTTFFVVIKLLNADLEKAGIILRNAVSLYSSISITISITEILSLIRK